MFIESKLFKAVLSFSLRVILAFILFIIPFIFLGVGNITAFIWIIGIEYGCNLIAFILSISYQRSEAQSKISWTILFILVPGGGAFIYFSGGMVPFWRKRKIKETELLENGLHNQINYAKNDKQLNKLFVDNYLIQNKPITYNNKIDFIFQGRNKFLQLFADLEKAESFINIQYFIMNDGIIFKQLEKILIKKQAEGVKIRILTDQLGSIATDDKTYDNLQAHGIKFAQFNPVRLAIVTGYANYRSHNKFVIIDNKIAYFGGLNIGDEYVGIVPKYGTWFDTHLRAEGDIVDQMNRQFQLQWRFTTGEVIINQEQNYPVLNETLPIQLFTDGPQYNHSTMLDNFITLLAGAKDKVIISSPYLVFPSFVLKAFDEAIKRGVKIEIITIGLADKNTAYLASKYYAERLVRRGVKVYRMENIFNHSKFFLFDQEMAIVGTSNLDYRALYLHFETDLLIEDISTVNRLTEVFEEWKTLSYELTNSSKNWNIFDRISFVFWKLFSPIL